MTVEINTGTRNQSQTSARESASVLTVVITTFEHERYIARALESVCRQETDFAFDVVVIDDCSSDRTVAVIDSVRSRYPNRLTVMRSPQNKNSHEDFGAVIDACTSPFMAMLDGDDYWTSNSKLAKQVAFLEAHPECVLCFHNVLLEVEGTDHEPRAELPRGAIPTFTERDDLWRGNYLRTCSVVFRRNAFERLPAWYYDSEYGDWELYVFLSAFGKIGYLDEVLAAYRVHTGGEWSGTSPVEQAQGCLDFLAHMERSLGPEFRSSQVAGLFQDCLRTQLLLETGDLERARNYLWRSFANRGVAGAEGRARVRALLASYARARLKRVAAALRGL